MVSYDDGKAIREDDVEIYEHVSVVNRIMNLHKTPTLEAFKVV